MNGTSGETTIPPKKEFKWKDHNIVLGLLLALLGLILAIGFTAAGWGSILKSSTITAINGASIYAVFYIMAQFVERLVEPFSDSGIFQGHDITDPKKKDEKAVALWGLATLFGIVMCFFTTGLFQIVGAPFGDLTWFKIIPGHTIDAVISGVIIGGGTKPLHDLINLFDKGTTKP